MKLPIHADVVKESMADYGTSVGRRLDFPVFLEPDVTGGYTVTCPSIPGCHSQGDTVEEALANIKEAIELSIEDIIAHHEPVPNPSKGLVRSVAVKV